LRIYLASNHQSQDRLKIVKEMLLERGHTVCSNWLTEGTAQAMEVLTEDQRQLFSYRDLGEILSADLLILDTREQSVSGGREVEYGAALALGKLVWRVGPARNVFHSIPRRSFDSWSEALEALGYARV